MPAWQRCFKESMLFDVCGTIGAIPGGGKATRWIHGLPEPWRKPRYHQALDNSGRR
jgi:hypothetical protein